ncbi:putative GTP-binding protein 6 [Tupaia chinensis]|uniref:putative GTP-binding protein 6 n=1 Tax=Tupaia chinensis TaxID=246437 RepID=UPI0007043FAC|nr:putative GTP-binding protein 6 [Tupaia chinensis]
MWALRAALRRGLRLPRVGREAAARRAVRLCPTRALAAFGPGGLEGLGGGRRGPRADDWRDPAGEDEEEPEEAEDEEGEEDDELLTASPLLPAGAQRVCLVHPEIKGGTGKQQTRAEWQVAEATALVHTLAGWSVVQTMVVPTRTPDSKLVFGKGSLEHLTGKIRGSPEITAVFLNVERMAAPTKKELEAAWGVEVFDRFTIVLHIFRCNARTREARLQVALAEIPLLRSRLRDDSTHLHRGGGGSRCILGSGEGRTGVLRRRLKEKELKIQRALERLRAKRRVLRRERARRELPTIAVVGYTNCGKTTLIRALTGDPAARPRDQLFATLDVTAHAGSLPSRMTVVYVDTVGFLSQLPHGLVEAFSATLEDVAHSDLILHVRDVSHPEAELQKASVLGALRGLRLPPTLLDSVLEVHNKVDLLPGYSPPEPGVLAVSALQGCGLQELKARLEEEVLRATGRRVLTLRVRLAGAQLSWLHTEATVQEVAVIPEDGVADVTVVISHSAYGRFRKLFPD